MTTITLDHMAPETKQRLFTWAIRSVIAYIILSIPLVLLGQRYTFANNLTESLPQQFFIIEKGVMPKKGDYVAFKIKKNPYYPTDYTFIKILGGVAGDEVTMDAERRFYVNGEYFATAKRVSKIGLPLEVGPTGVIPANHVLVYTPSVDGYDSRYRDVGWVEDVRIVGRAFAPFE